MDKLFEEFFRERTFIRNLSPRTMGFYKQLYGFWKGVGAFDDLSKASLQDSLIKFRERGVSPGALNTYIRGINTFLKWIHTEHSELRTTDLSMKFLRVQRRVQRSLTDNEIKRLITLAFIKVWLSVLF